MRGRPVTQPQFLTALNPESRIPATHPLRAIKKFCDEALKRLSPLFEELYAEGGRASIPPEQLLKARVLMALYSVRSERRFCDQLQWNILWMWFLDREVKAQSTCPFMRRSLFEAHVQKGMGGEVRRGFEAFWR